MQISLRARIVQKYVKLLYEIDRGKRLRYEGAQYSGESSEVGKHRGSSLSPSLHDAHGRTDGQAMMYRGP